MDAAGAFRHRPPRGRELVSTERVVVAPDQGTGSRLQGVLPGAIRTAVLKLRGPLLITGATGFAGGHLVESLAGEAEIIGWGRSAPRPALAHLAMWQVIDLLDCDRIASAIASIRPAAIFHLAGAPQVAESWRDGARPL